ncbi:hypothetical protein CBG25_20185 [Arsenophonus sp. ENCA]|nr:hypothetical protein CBG25_20185 [Arsenophonus sp. ENCA]
MGLKLRLSWFEKTADDIAGEEYSRDLRDDGSVIEQLGLTIEDNVNNGEFNVKSHWVTVLNPYFNHKIQYDKYDYFVSFDYADEWPEDMRTLRWDLHGHPSAHEQGGSWHMTVTPEISGEILRASYQYHGNRLPNAMMQVHLLGGTIDCDLGNVGSTLSFTPQNRQLTQGQAFEVVHPVTPTRHSHKSLKFIAPMPLIIELAVRVDS